MSSFQLLFTRPIDTNAHLEKGTDCLLGKPLENTQKMKKGTHHYFGAIGAFSRNSSIKRQLQLSQKEKHTTIATCGRVLR